jgi:hypothetical protein
VRPCSRSMSGSMRAAVGGDLVDKKTRSRRALPVSLIIGSTRIAWTDALLARLAGGHAGVEPLGAAE